MFDLTRKTLALGVSATCLLLQISEVRAETISIGVAANFAATIQDIADAYFWYHGGGVSFSISSDSTGNLKSAILAGGTTSGPYDLFLSADTAAPAAVSTLGMVYSGVTQAPFFYANGSVVFGSATTSVSGGVPNPISPALVIADPSKAPYGLAAMTVLNQAPWSLGLSTTSSYPVSNVYISSNIGTTYAAVSATTYAYGFLAKSSVCRNTGSGDAVAGYPNNVTNVYEYKYDGSAGLGHAGTTSQTYPQIVQNGIAIQRSAQTPTTQALVIDFINYLLTNSDGIYYRTLYCYGT